MGIEDYKMEDLMTYPDHLFGRRWPVFVEVLVSDAVPVWDIAEINLPEQGVIWEVGWQLSCSEQLTQNWRLLLGDVLPTTVAEANLLEPVLHGLGTQGATPRDIRAMFLYENVRIEMRKQFDFNSKSLILEVDGVADKYMLLRAWIVVSSMPKEIPAWLSSG